MTPPVITPANVSLTQILLAVFTILTSGVVSAVVTYRLNALKTEREFMRAKLELLYLAVDNFTEVLTLTNMSMIPVLSGATTYELVTEATKENKQAFGGQDAQTATMLISIYFPELKSAFDKVLDSRNKIGQRIIGAAIAKKLPINNKELQEWFRK